MTWVLLKLASHQTASKQRFPCNNLVFDLQKHLRTSRFAAFTDPVSVDSCRYERAERVGSSPELLGLKHCVYGGRGQWSMTGTSHCSSWWRQETRQTVFTFFCLWTSDDILGVIPRRNWDIPACLGGIPRRFQEKLQELMKKQEKKNGVDPDPENNIMMLLTFSDGAAGGGCCFLWAWKAVVWLQIKKS